MAIVQNQLWRFLWLLICLSLAACGGGGGGGGAPSDSTPIADPVPAPDPVDPTDVDESNLSTYLAVARQAWQNYGAGGLPAVIAELENEANDPRYDYEQVVEFVKNLQPYANVWSRRDYDHPFTLTNSHKAIAAGLSGRGQIIAIYDDGFDIHHPDLITKEIDCGLPAGQHGAGDHGNCSRDSADHHGTATSVVAAGLPTSDSGLLGIARNSSLVLFDWDLINYHDATKAATAAGATVYSNSFGWIFPVFNMERFQPGFNCPVPLDEGRCGYIPIVADSRSFFNALPWNYFTYTYDDLMEALESFQDQGVIVFAKSNDDPGLTEDYYEFLSDLPHHEEQLQEAWISVVEALVRTDGEGNVIAIYRDSAPCNFSAAWCLVGNGYVNLAMDTGEGGPYGAAHGTSFVAPQVAGAVALMAEAFPSLSPADLTARLLASANNRWFQNNGDIGYNPAASLGNRCWNEGEDNEFCHAYSQEWGHGIMDVEAALMPVGDLYTVNGAQLQGAARATLSEAALSAPSNSFESLQQALSVPLTTFDALNGNFEIKAANLVAEQDAPPGAVTLLRRFERLGGTRIGSVPTDGVFEGQGLSDTFGKFSYSQTYDVSADGVPTEFEIQYQTGHSAIRVGFGFTSEDKTPSFGGLSSAGYAINPTGFADLLGNVAYVSVGTGIEVLSGAEDAPATITLYSFTGENGADTTGSISGLGARIGLNIERTRLELSATMVAESGSYFGIAGHEDVWFGGTTNLAAGQIALRHELGDGLSLTAWAEIGTVSDGADEGQVSLISQMDATLYTGFEIGLEQRNLLKDKDAFALWASQPMRIEESGLTFTLPSGRTKEGDILYQDFSADLTPDTRQIDIGFSYRLPSDDGFSETQIGVMQSFNHGHVAGKHATSVAARHVMRF